MQNKGPLKFYKDIKEGNITLGKAEGEQKEFKNEITHILKWKNKTDGQIHAINNIKTLYKSREKLSNCLVIILELHLKLNTKQNMEKVSKYQLLQKCFKDYD